MNSRRLPGKPLFKISKDTVISVVVNRVKKIKALEHFCIATSVENSDDPIEEEANKIGIDVVRGSLNDIDTLSDWEMTELKYRKIRKIN